MSLEANIALNNDLLAQNNVLMAEMLKALAGQQQVAVGSAAQPNVEATQTAEAETYIDDLDFEATIALSCMYPESQHLTATDYQRAIDYKNATGKDRDEKIDALYMALQGVKRAEHLYREVLRGLCWQMLENWGDLPGITERREFAERWLDEKPENRHKLKPAKPKKARKGPFYFRDGEAFGETDTEAALKELIAQGCIEINKVEYLQLKEAAEKEAKAVAEEPTATKPDVDPAALRAEATAMVNKLVKAGYRAEAVELLGKFGAKKLGEVADGDLADFVAQAEAVLADDAEDLTGA